MVNSALISSKKMDWCTPQDFFDRLNEEFGFVLDAAATDKTAKCPIYYTPETDGLSQSWDRGGAVFCNPPYGREIGKWVKKAYEEAIGGGYAIVLLRIGGLDYVGFEINAKYFEAANRRLEEEKAQIRLFDLLEAQERATQTTLF